MWLILTTCILPLVLANEPITVNGDTWELRDNVPYINGEEQAGKSRCLWFDGVVINYVSLTNNKIYQRKDKFDGYLGTEIEWPEVCPEPYYTGLRDSDQCGPVYCTAPGIAAAKDEWWRLHGTTLFIDGQEQAGASRCLWFDGVVFNLVSAGNSKIYQRVNSSDGYYGTDILWTEACPAAYYTRLRDSDQCTGPVYC